jgi:hypothetical protein
MNHKYRYDVINKQGYAEQYTGIFDTKELAENWFRKYGKGILSEGRNIFLVKCKTKFQTDITEQRIR